MENSLWRGQIRRKTIVYRLGSDSKESAFNTRNSVSIPELGRSPGEEILTPVFLPGEFHGQRSLAGYGPWSRKESDTTGQTTLSPLRSPQSAE